jgi:hypothetical protein
MPKLRKDVVAVVYLIHIPNEHNVKLFVGDVPTDVSEAEIKNALEAGGYRFSEFGMPWVNHYLVRLHEADPQVRGAWRRLEDAEADDDEGEGFYISWSGLSEETDETEVLFLRVPSKLKSALLQKAGAGKISLNEYCARALASAAQ